MYLHGVTESFILRRFAENETWMQLGLHRFKHLTCTLSPLCLLHIGDLSTCSAIATPCGNVWLVLVPAPSAAIANLYSWGMGAADFSKGLQALLDFSTSHYNIPRNFGTHCKATWPLVLLRPLEQ